MVVEEEEYLQRKLCVKAVCVHVEKLCKTHRTVFKDLCVCLLHDW